MKVHNLNFCLENKRCKTLKYKRERLLKIKSVLLLKGVLTDGETRSQPVSLFKIF